MPPDEHLALSARLAAAHAAAPGRLYGAHAVVSLDRLAVESVLAQGAGGGSVLVCVRDPMQAAVALVELDGRARRLVLCPPGVDPAHLAAVAASAQADAVVTDAPSLPAGVESLVRLGLDAEPAPRARAAGRSPATQWILLTSGTSGVPKLVVHDLATLCGAIPAQGSLAGPRVWSTFYDVRRYGGLQILLRALLGGGSLVLADPEEGVDAFIARALRAGVTHLTGTPSHWRRALMNPEAHRLPLQYARMSGEIADQAIIDRLRAAYPAARVAHAYASTEAGVGFEVDDGCEGFPSGLVGREGGSVALRVVDGTLRIRSERTAHRYLAGGGELRDAQGYVDTGDVVELRGDRYHFVGRRGGIINVGGLKVHPEEIEAVINRHPRVRISRVQARRNPITGAIVVAEVVRTPAQGAAGDAADDARLRDEIIANCRAALAAYKVPATIRFVARIDVTASGKIARADG